MTTNIKNLNAIRSMKKQLILTSIMGLLALSFISSAYSQNFEALPNQPNLREDEVIICVNDPNTQENNSDIICHTYPIDNVDWYQETSENKYGQFGQLEDSFEMGLID